VPVSAGQALPILGQLVVALGADWVLGLDGEGLTGSSILPEGVTGYLFSLTVFPRMLHLTVLTDGKRSFGWSPVIVEPQDL